MPCAKSSGGVKWFPEKEKENQEEYETVGAWKTEKIVC